MTQTTSHNIVTFPSGHSLQVGEQHIALRPDGWLVNLTDWTPDVAQALAAKEGLVLVVQHWKVLNAMRDYYASYNVTPVKKLLKRALKEAGAAALTSDAALDELFPGGVMMQASRIAGVPMPLLDAELERSNCGKPAAPDATHFVDKFEFKGKSYAVTCMGNLLDLHLWNEELAEFLAQKEGITLTANHWEILTCLRSFYFEFGVTPMVKILMKHMANEVGVEHVNREYLYKLFPKGPSRQGSRIAGLPEPQGCIDG